ncbi:hypothetical protein FRB90_004395 [Tulasnella sp. 427]|nr:hypothetical protein FRB90_004395 [Tulasnella sp. 427]
MQSVLPKRRAAKLASSNLAQQLKPLPRRKSAPERLSVIDDQTSIDGSTSTKDIPHAAYGVINGTDDPNSSSSTSDEAPSRRKPVVQRTYGKKTGKGSRPPITKAASDVSLLSRSSSLSHTSNDIGLKSASSRKRGRQSDPSEADLGIVPKRKRSFLIVSVPEPPKSSVKVPSKPKPKPKAAVSQSAPEPKKPKNSLDVGSLVWVRLDNDGRALASSETPGMWWPSTVQSSSESSTDVQLLGKSVPGGYKNRQQTIENSSGGNILSFRQSSRIRFGASSFTERGFDSTHIAPTDSPTKPTTVNLQSIWEAGFADALALDAGDDDDLPEAELVFSQPPSTPTPTPKTKEPKLQTPKDIQKIPAVWKPDPKLAPGTTVLCRDTRQSQTYWPAKINEVISSNKPGAPGKYKVIYCDGLVKNVPGEWIVTEDQDDFLTCRLGWLKVDGEDLDEDGRKSPIPRDPSPEPRHAPPTESEFEDLDLREQVACIRPILHKIISGDYLPAKTRHDAFIQGGRQRQQLSQNIATGDLTTSQLDSILHEIRRWALRGERWTHANEITYSEDQPPEQKAETAEETGASTELPPTVEAQDATMTDAEEDWRTMPSEKVPRPEGCPEYETLGGSERSQYCSDVLLPEALVQLHALRRGKRIERLLEDNVEAEQAFYDAAAKSLAEEELIDGWVDRVLARRQQRRIARGMPATESEESGKGSGNSPAKGSTRSRRAYN